MSELIQQIKGSIGTAKGGSIVVAALALASAFGLQVTQAQQASILVFGGAASAILFTHGASNAFKYLTPPTLSGLVAGGIGVAIAFGAPITHVQSEQVIEITALISGLLLTGGIAHTIARDRREPAPAKAPEGTAVLGLVESPHAGSLHADLQKLIASLIDPVTGEVKKLVVAVEGDAKKAEAAASGAVKRTRAKAAAKVAPTEPTVAAPSTATISTPPAA